VVAAQIGSVMAAIKEGRQRFVFLGQDIRLIPSCGIFVGALACTCGPGAHGAGVGCLLASFQWWYCALLPCIRFPDSAQTFRAPVTTHPSLPPACR
jgi:hypothetical protein